MPGRCTSVRWSALLKNKSQWLMNLSGVLPLFFTQTDAHALLSTSALTIVILLVIRPISVMLDCRVESLKFMADGPMVVIIKIAPTRAAIARTPAAMT